MTCELLMRPTDFGSSISEVVSLLWNCLVDSFIALNVNGIIIIIQIFISSCS